MRAGMLTARRRGRWNAALLLPAVLALAACASGTAGPAADLVVPSGATAPDPTASRGGLVDDDPAAGEPAPSPAQRTRRPRGGRRRDRDMEDEDALLDSAGR